jgi:hypothetical protein
MKKQPSVDSALVTVPVAARIIGINATILRDLIEAGIIPALKNRSTIMVSQTQCQIWKKKLQDHDIPKNQTCPSYMGLRLYEPSNNAARMVRKRENHNIKIGVNTRDFLRKKKNVM